MQFLSPPSERQRVIAVTIGVRSYSPVNRSPDQVQETGKREIKERSPKPFEGVADVNRLIDL